MTILEVNQLDPQTFVDVLGGIYEHSPWVAESVWHKRPFSSLEELAGLMRMEVESAGVHRQLELLRAHPDLGTRARISPASMAEQAGAGLAQLSHDEYNLFTTLNCTYRDKFGFPFLLAVKGSGKAEILRALTSRIDSDCEAELATALREVHRIAIFRLQELFDHAPKTLTEPT